MINNTALGYTNTEELMDYWNMDHALRIAYHNGKNEIRYFGIEEDARGVNIWWDEIGVEHREESFASLDDLLDYYVTPDGVPFRQIMNGCFD